MRSKPNLKAVYFFLTLGTLLLACKFGGLLDFPVTPAFTSTPAWTKTPTLTPSPTWTSTPAFTKTPYYTADRRVLNPENQHLYLYVEYGKSWHAASFYCKSLGGHLVTIESAVENGFIYNLFGENIWLGASDEAQEANWVWVTGQPLDFTYWDSGEPNNAGIENYLTFSGNGKTWNDIPDGPMPFVCEWE